MSGGAPIILTAEELATREARTVVMVSSEEILPRKIKAYASSNSEISFMFRQPSASAIMINKPSLELEVRFKMTKNGVFNGGDYSLNKKDRGSNLNDNNAVQADLYGRSMEGLPFLSKCVRTSVISINGATQTYRNSEVFTPYLRTQVSREAMKKINVGWNSMQGQRNGGTFGFSVPGGVDCLTENDSEQADQFQMQSTMDNTLAVSHANAAPAVSKFAVDAADANSAISQRMTIREPLFMSIFGGLQGNDAFPLWSCEQNKSPSILHAQQITINLNLLDNWAQNLYGLIQTAGNQAAQYEVTGVEIISAMLCCTYVQPPPKFIAASLSSNVTYASHKMLRFDRPAAGNVLQMDPMAPDQNTSKFRFEVLNFPYMPSCFMIEIAPDYNYKSKRIAGGFGVDGATSRDCLDKYLQSTATKEDRRLGIVALDLIINTSPDVVPSHGTNTYQTANIINVRYNSRQLYDLYLKNCASVERAPYSFSQWFRCGCTVLLTPADFNGILTPAHCRGAISVSGSVSAVNTLPYSVYVGNGSPNAGIGATNPLGGNLEKFNCSIIGVYSNCYMALDAKSGLVGENIMSEQFAAGLRLTDV